MFSHGSPGRLRRVVRLLIAVALLFGLAGLLAASAFAANPPQPNSQTQPLADGCQRNVTGLLSFTSPEWVYVYKDPSVRFAQGTATQTHTAGGDLPEGHDFYDLNSNVTVDPTYNYLLSTANFTGDKTAEDYGRLHVEWESGSVPRYVWPTEGDSVSYWGSWIWDCGHWGPSPGVSNPDLFLPGQGQAQCTPASCPGEHTEFHPMRAMVVQRANPSVPSSTQTQTDVYISTDGTLAHAEAQCALAHPPPSPDTYGVDYTACVQDPSQRYQQVNDRNYSFFVPAPPKPAPNAKLVYRIADQGVGVNSPEPLVEVRSTGIQVTIPFKNFGINGTRQVFGKTFYVGWTIDPTPPTHLQAHFSSISVVHSMDPPSDLSANTDDPGAEWNLYTDLNGNWSLANDWAPGLGFLLDGTTIPVDKTFDFYVPAGKGVRLFVNGRECDLPKVQPCPANPGEVASDNDVPGEILNQFPSAAAAIGTHTATADSGNYTVTYSITPAP
ncbi:MAG: hypothetical protein QOD66_807 [Solirubrobacteraceae bacterium]|nr:hypothetical protein [Solirubrobacteraceae bacterium]